MTEFIQIDQFSLQIDYKKKDEIHSISQKYKRDDIFYFILQNHKSNNYCKNINSELFSNYKGLS